MNAQISSYYFYHLYFSFSQQIRTFVNYHLRRNMPKAGRPRIGGTFFCPHGAGTAGFPARQYPCLRINRMPAVRASTAVHDNHFYAGCRGDMRCAGIDRNQQVAFSDDCRQRYQACLAAEVFDRLIHSRYDLVGIKTVIRCAYNKK